MPKRTYSQFRAGMHAVAGRGLKMTGGKRKSVVRRKAPLKRRKAYSLNVHKFSRYSTAATVECAGTEARDKFEFKFADVLNYSEFTNLFDQYKIRKGVVCLQLMTNPDSTYALNVGGSVGQMANWLVSQVLVCP